MMMFDVVLAIVAVLVIGSLLVDVGKGKRKHQQSEYQDVTIAELHEALRGNPFNARETYMDRRIRVTGKLGSINSSGRSFKVSEHYGLIDCERVRCWVDSEDVRMALSEMRNGEQVTVCGKVSAVDGTFGYTLAVEGMNN